MTARRFPPPWSWCFMQSHDSRPSHARDQIANHDIIDSVHRSSARPPDSALIIPWILQLPFVALLINIGLIALAAWIVQGPFVALLAIVGFAAAILSAVRWARDIRRHRTATTAP